MMNGYHDRLLDHAQHQMRQGNRPGAIQNLKRVLGEEPQHALAHALLALCLLHTKRVYAAQHEISIAIQLEPEQPFGHYVQGHIALADRQFKRALSHFETAIQLQPDVSAFHLGLAQLHAVAGDRKRQFAALEHALALDPNNEECHTDLGEYFQRIGELGKAEDCARTAMQLNPDCLGAITLMGTIHLMRGNIQEAREHALWALRHDPASTSTLSLLAAIKARTNLFLGLWWRFNATMSRLGESKVIFVLILMYVMYRVAAQALTDFQLPAQASMVSLAWLGLVIYTWVGPALFQRSLAKELKAVSLHKDF